MKDIPDNVEIPPDDDNEDIFESQDEDSLFEESVLNTTFSSSINSPTASSEDSLFASETENISTTNEDDLLDLRGLFDEDAVDPEKIDSTLDFEEIPDDIDIDEPIEIEELSQTGRIMNVVVKATLVIFALVILGFIINSALVIGAVLSSNFQSRIFVDVSGLDRKVASIDLTVMTEVSNFGSFIDGELDPILPVRVRIYLSENEQNPKASEAIGEIIYQPPKDKDVLKFNGGKRNIYNLQGIQLKLNPNFDSSKLSGFMEPRGGPGNSTFHPRYPRKLIVRYSANLVIKSFWIPIPYELDQMSKVEMDKIDPVVEKKRAADMKAFDFNPKFLDIIETSKEKILIKARQPVPKIFAPPFYQVAVHMPPMDFSVKQFTLHDPMTVPDLDHLFYSQSKPLAKIRTEPFRMIMADGDLTPNIVSFTAEIRRNHLDGLLNVLKAIRDADLSTLAFFFASSEFIPGIVKDAESNDKNSKSKDVKKDEVSRDNAAAFKEDVIDGCTLKEFLRSFWGRQAYPVPLADEDDQLSNSALPSIPEFYNPLKDSALKFEFKGLLPGPPPLLNFQFTANNHFLISQYKLPILMLSGQLPPIHFKLQVKNPKKHVPVALITCIHEADAGNKKNFVMNIQMEILNLKVLTHFALKMYRLWRVSNLEEINNDAETSENNASKAQSDGDDSKKSIQLIQSIVGKMFKDIEGAEIVANFRDNSENWISQIASVFDMKFDLTGRSVKFVYSGNGRSIIAEPTKKRKSLVYSEDAEEEIIKALNGLLNIKIEGVDAIKDEDYERVLLERVEELKVTVAAAEQEFLQESQSKDNFSTQAREACVDELKASEEAASKSVSVEELVKAAAEKSTSALDSHRKLLQVRSLLIKRLELLKVHPVPVKPIENSLLVDLDSTEKEFSAAAALALHETNRLFDDHMIVEWGPLHLAFSNPKSKTQLAQLQVFPASFKMSLLDSSISDNTPHSTFSTNIKPLKVKLLMGPNSKKDSKLTVPVWMKSLKDFNEAFMDVKNYFVPLEVTVNSIITWETDLPAAGVPIPTNGARQQILDTTVEPGFFDNLAKSYFDFIGYGFYRLIFHAILPNPDECPAGSSLLNVELNLPATSTFLHVSADTGDLRAGKFAATINTARPLRLWTQIIDGVLCNGYAVSEGLEEQELAIQARIPRQKSIEIVESFSKIIELREIVKKKPTDTPDNSVKDSSSKSIASSEDTILAYQDARAKKSPNDLSQIPLDKRFALITAVPVSVEILNFEHLIKIVDAFGEKRLVTIGTEDPTKDAAIPGRSQPSLFNVLISALASKFPVSFNTPDQIAKAAKVGAEKVIRVSDEKVVLEIDTFSPSPTELKVKARIYMPARLDGEDKNSISLSDSESVDNSPTKATNYVPFEAVNPERRFKHPIIRWGRTELTFTFPKFLVSLKLSPGVIEVTNDGSEILFDALKDLKLELGIKGRPEEASKSFDSLFKVASIRQVFKRCENYYRKRIDYAFDEASVIGTTSKVVYGPADRQKFHFFGSADMESLYLLQAVILRQVFTNGDKSDFDASSDSDNISTSAAALDDDPTRIDFGMLISLGKNKTSASSTDKGYKEDDSLSGLSFKELRSKIPRVGLPCFFKNFCSPEQLSRTAFDKDGLTGRFDHIPVNLHIRNTFQPITASIASGFATFLTLFHLPTYPKTFEWVLRIPEEQAVGVEMNGLGMVYGIAGPLEIVKSAEIPYPRSKPDISGSNDKKIKKNSKKKNKKKRKDTDIGSSDDETDEYRAFVENEDMSFIWYSSRDIFEKTFSKHLLEHKFKDEVIIPVRAQLPESLPGLLREMLWPMFFIPINTVTLHPPLINIENQKPDELTYQPIAIGLSDTMNYKDKHGHFIRPSLLTKLFAGFIAEESSPGLEVHRVNLTNKPSTFKFHWTGNMIPRKDWTSLGKDLMYSDMGDMIHVVIWLQYPWPMGSIGFDFGSKIRGQIYLTDRSEKQVFVDGFLSTHLMIGKVARMRIDLVISKAILSQLVEIPAALLKDKFSGLAQHFWYLSSSPAVNSNTSIADIPLRIEFNVDDNFLIETDAIIPKSLFTSPPLPIRPAGIVRLFHTRRNIDGLLAIYAKEAPHAIACVYNNKIPPGEEERQALLWSQLDLSKTHLYFANISSLKPGDDLQLFFQLRTVDSVPLCGHLTAYEGGLGVMIEYIQPKHPFEQLYSPVEQSPRIFHLAKWDPITSIYVIKTKLNITGHYRVYVALLKRASDKLESQRYRQVEYSKFYVQHTR